VIGVRGLGIRRACQEPNRRPEVTNRLRPGPTLAGEPGKTNKQRANVGSNAKAFAGKRKYKNTNS
jgi:hypothetical protein